MHAIAKLLHRYAAVIFTSVNIYVYCTLSLQLNWGHMDTQTKRRIVSMAWICRRNANCRVHLLLDCRGCCCWCLCCCCCSSSYSCCRNKKAISKAKTKRRRTNQSRLQFPVLLQVKSLAADVSGHPMVDARGRERETLSDRPDQTRPVDSQCERRPRARVRERPERRKRERERARLYPVQSPALRVLWFGASFACQQSLRAVKRYRDRYRYKYKYAYRYRYFNGLFWKQRNKRCS